MEGFRRFAVLVGLLLASGLVVVHSASAKNSVSFRDCSFTGGLDPDYVDLSGASVDSHGRLAVTPAQHHVTVKASESADPGDSAGHDTLNVTLSAPNAPSRTLSGAGVGHVSLSVPLAGAAVGTTYTIAWSATFDNANHHCPSSMTPDNTTAHPFVLNVVASTPTSPIISALRQSHRVWREPGGRHRPLGKHRPPLGTVFRFRLNEPATVSLMFSQELGGRRVNGRCVRPTSKNRKRVACRRVAHRGRLPFAGHSGVNRVPFGGLVSRARKLSPGRYTLVAIAANAEGQRSQPLSLGFTIAR